MFTLPVMMAAMATSPKGQDRMCLAEVDALMRAGRELRAEGERIDRAYAEKWRQTEALLRLVEELKPFMPPPRDKK